MLQSIFTSFHPFPVGRSAWYKIRKLTMEDLVITPWNIPEPAVEKQLNLQSCATIACRIRINPEVLSLLPEMENASILVLSKFTRFLNKLIYVNHSPKIEIDAKYVGTRKEKQWLKYNEALEKAKAIHAKIKDKTIEEALEDLNSRLQVMVEEENSEFIQESIRHYSDMASYDIRELDEKSGNDLVNKQISRLNKMLKRLKAKRSENRRNFLNKFWNENNSIPLPSEVLDVVRSTIKEKGFFEPNDIFGYGER